MFGRRASAVKVWSCLLVGAVLPVVFAAVVVAEDGIGVVRDGPTLRVAPEISVNGLTVQEYYDRMAERHRLVTGLTPAGTLNNRIGISLTQNEQAELRGVVPVSGEPLRIGTVKSLPTPLTVAGIVSQEQNARVAGGSFQVTNDGGFSWAIAVGSEDAHAIRVHFKNFSLPPNAEMYIFDTADEAYGP